MQANQPEEPKQGIWFKIKSRFSKRYCYALNIFIFSLGFIMVIESPGPLQYATIKRYNLTSYQYTMMFSVSCWASFVDVVHGFIIDRYLGLKLATFIYTGILTLGSTLYAISGFTPYFCFMIIGRFIFGLGGNPLLICMNGYILHWFEGNELNTVFSFQISILWLGSSITFLVFYRLLQYLKTFSKLSNTYGITVCTTVIILTMMIICSLMSLVSAYTKKDKTAGKTETSDKNKKVAIRDILNFPLVFWMLVLSSFVYFLAVLNFVITAEVYLSRKYHISIGSASTMAGVLGILACILSPLFGRVIDKFGRNLSFITMGVLLGMAAHGIYAFTMWNAIIPLVLMALSSTLSTFVFPVVNYMVDRHQISTAYGLAQTVLNGSMGVGSLISGYIIDKYGYGALEKFYFYILTASLPAWCLIWYLNYRTGNVLNMSAKERLRINTSISS